MFESAELGHAIDDATYQAEVPTLREKLLDAQYDLLERKSAAVVIVIGGVDGAGKGETVNLLNEWMDPRHIQTHALGAASDEELGHPPMWRFWRRLPPKGKIGVFFGSWYTQPIVRRAYGETKNATLDQQLERIVELERMLSAEGVLLLKFWFHLSERQQRRRLKSLERDARTRWRVTPLDWQHFKLYATFRKISERALRATSTAEAPWIVVEGADANYRSLTVGKALLSALRRRLDEPAPAPAAQAAPLLPPIDQRSVLSSLDLSVRMSKEAYEKRLEKLQGRLNLLVRDKGFARRAVVALFEGSDAAGKGGAIRRVTSALDARQYHVIPVAAPTDEERAQPYLWRFWRSVPRLGKVAIFDRSWYGRVLVERVEGFCSEADWLRAYAEINAFEEQLVEHGTIVVKFWLQTSPEEQLRRFEERQATGFKRYKITPDDWRNREKWPAYVLAASDMIDRTSTSYAPWTLVPAEDKHVARIDVLRTLCERIEASR